MKRVILYPKFQTWTLYNKNKNHQGNIERKVHFIVEYVNPDMKIKMFNAEQKG